MREAMKRLICSSCIRAGCAYLYCYWTLVSVWHYVPLNYILQTVIGGSSRLIIEIDRFLLK